MPSYTPHAGVYLDVVLMPAQPGADYCEDWPRIDEFDIERDRHPGEAGTLHVYAWIAPRAPGDPCTLRHVRLDGAIELRRAAIVAPGVCVRREPCRGALYPWICVSTLTGLSVGHGYTRRECVAEFWRRLREWPPGDFDAAHVLMSAARRLARAPLGGEISA